MKKMTKLILILIGFALIINALAFYAVSSFTFGILAELIIGVILIFAGIYFTQIIVSTGIKKLMWIVLAVGIVFSLCFSVFLFVYGTIDTVDYNEDAIVVLGAGLNGDRLTIPLKLRLDKTLQYYVKNKDVKIVVTGGMGPGETVTESYAMKKYLVQMGIPKEIVFEDSLSVSTYENFLFAKKILDKEFSDFYTIAFVTNNFHIYRASRIAKTVGFSSNHVSIKAQWYSMPVNYLRECAAVFKYFILKR